MKSGLVRQDATMIITNDQLLNGRPVSVHYESHTGIAFDMGGIDAEGRPNLYRKGEGCFAEPVFNCDDVPEMWVNDSGDAYLRFLNKTASNQEKAA